jgi:ABC-type multidrug transport system ATPase subunit
MYVKEITARNIFSFAELDLKLNPCLTVVTGPNGSGKTNLARLFDLVVRAVRNASGNQAALSRRYNQAGYFGSQRFTAAIGIVFDQPDELTLIEEWGKAAVLTLLAANTIDRALAMEPALPDSIGAADAFGSGTLEVSYDATRRAKWRTEWIVRLGSAEARLSLEQNRLSVDAPAAHAADAVQLNQWLSARNDPLTADQPQGRRSSFGFTEFAEVTPTELWVRTLAGAAEPASVRHVYECLGLSVDGNHSTVSFAHILDHLLSHSLLTTANRRAEISTELSPAASDGTGPVNIDVDGSRTAVELYRLKNGGPAQRAQFSHAQTIFHHLTDRTLDIQAVPAVEDGPTGVQVPTGEYVLSPVVQTRGPGGTTVDLPLDLSGAGIEEAAVLATLLTASPQVAVLDEPATNLSPVAQRRLVKELKDLALPQTILITHSPHLVPFEELEDLSALVRLTRDRSGRTVAHHPTADAALFDRLRRLYRSADMRAALFASAVLLVEGREDEAALRVWLPQMIEHGLPSPEEVHVLVLNVDGDTEFGNYTNMLDQLGVPYGVLADGPAFRNGALDRLPRVPVLADTDNNDFSDLVARWRAVNVHTLAADFADEIAAFFERTNPQVWAETIADGKVRRANHFASCVPAPDPIVDLWKTFLGAVGLC